MADRIERYLGRLEAELAGRVEGVRLEEILVEVEGHLRESEEAYRELGEPEELANRLAVDGFGGVPELSVQIEEKAKFSSEWVRCWVNAGRIASFISVCGLIVVSALISSMTLAFWVVIVPFIVVLFSSFFVRAGAFRRMAGGVVTASICLLILFLAVGRSTFSGGWPILGLSLGNGNILYGGAVHSIASDHAGVEWAERLVAEGEKHLHVARYGPVFDFEEVPYEGQGGALLINASDQNWGYSRTEDFVAARKSWLSDGELFLERVRESERQARSRFQKTREMDNASLGVRLMPLLGALFISCVLSGVALGICVALGVGLRWLVEQTGVIVQKGVKFG